MEEKLHSGASEIAPDFGNFFLKIFGRGKLVRLTKQHQQTLKEAALYADEWSRTTKCSGDHETHQRWKKKVIALARLSTLPKRLNLH